MCLLLSRFRHVQVSVLEASQVTRVDVSRLVLRWPDALRWAVSLDPVRMETWSAGKQKKKNL